MTKKSMAEEKLNHQIFDHDLPSPDREVSFDDDRKWRFDFAWSDIMLAVEVEGGVWSGGRHTRPAGFEKDCEKYNHAAVKGWIVLRVTSKMIDDGSAIKIVIAGYDFAVEAFYGDLD